NHLGMLCLAAWAATLFLTGNRAAAQFATPTVRPQFQSFNRPALSPYLNLLRGTNPAANYYLGVVSEFDRRATKTLYGNAIQNLAQRQLDTSVPAEIELEVATGLPATGHPAYFNNLGSYFPVGGQPRATPTRTANVAPRRR